MRKIVRFIIYALLVFCVYSLVMELKGQTRAQNKKGINETLGIAPAKR